MKIVTVMGSPRLTGNTGTILKAFERGAAQTHEVERINLIDYNYSGCLGCDTCQEVSDVPGCGLEDDGTAIIRSILAADLVVYATPVYIWSFPAGMKALMERHFALVKSRLPGAPSLIAGKLVMLLVTCKGTAIESADLVLETFKREMDYLDCTTVGRYVVDSTTSPNELGERRKDTAQMMLHDLAANPAWIARSRG